MSANHWIVSVSVLALSALLGPAQAQQTTGVPGSPSATTTIEGSQLPPQPQPFHGKIERNAAQRHRTGPCVSCRLKAHRTSS